MATIHVRTNDADKNRAQEILANLGLDLSTVINMLIKQINYHEKIPFDIEIPKGTQENGKSSITELKNKFESDEFWMSPDFNAPLECMEDYM